MFKWTNKNQERNAYREAISNLEVQKNTAEFYAAELYNSAYPLRRTKIESYRKFTLSIACLIFFFIGAPIGAIVRKGGLGTPAIISILFFVLYWVVDISGKKLANDGAIGPFEGAFISTLVLAPIGAFLTWKSTRDSALFNPEVILNNISNFFKGLFSKAKRLQLKLEKEEQRKEAEREDREWHEREAREKTSADTNNSLKSNLTANDKL